MTTNKEEKDIDLLEFVRKLWDNKKFIIKITLIGAIIGLIIAFSIPKEYTSTVVFTTNSNDAKTGNMGALASLARINLGNMGGSEVFSPDLYPNIISSTSFIQGLLDINVRDKNKGIDTSLYVYLKDEQNEAWWNYVLKAPGLLVSLISPNKGEKKGNEVSKYFISNEEMKVIETLKGFYRINTDKKTGITTFEVTSQSPVISAFLVDSITFYLQSYIIQERTKKSQTDLENSHKLYNQYKDNYDKSQQKLALFADRNKNIISETYRINQKKLEDEVSLAYTVYNQMAQQVQVNEIKVQDDTPVFTIIQPAIEPIYPTGPKKKIILGALIFLSSIIAACWILRSDIISLFKTK